MAKPGGAATTRPGAAVFTGRADAGVELFLLPEERGIEAGRALLAYAIGISTDHRATVADTNAAMLAVNARLGFTPVRRTAQWALPLGAGTVR